MSIPVRWGDLGIQMAEAGVIDRQKFDAVYADRGGIGDDIKALLEQENNDQLTVTPENSGQILNLLWALGLANRNQILDNGPMQDPRYGGAGGFALVEPGGCACAKPGGGRQPGQMARHVGPA